jgi:hypothetical protein
MGGATSLSDVFVEYIGEYLPRSEVAAGCPGTGVGLFGESKKGLFEAYRVLAQILHRSSVGGVDAG